MSYNKFILPSIENCRYVEGGDFCLLTNEQYEKVQKICRAITEDKHTNFIYRGNNNLREIFKTDVHSFLFAERLFMVGEKSKEFLHLKYTDNEIKEEHAIWLFNEIQKSLTKDSNNDRVKKRLDTFKAQNRKMIDFFSISSNKEKFVTILQGPHKWHVNDYYEMFLHTIERLGKKNINSTMLSTSLSLEVAKRFSQASGIILIGWFKKWRYIRYVDVNKRDPFIETLGLPSCNIGVFPDQQEICLKYGLLPHNILGYLYNDQFTINHHFFLEKAHDNLSIKKILINGFDIDQQNFTQHLEHTKYVRGFDVVSKYYLS